MSRVYSCSICGISSKRRWNLERHISTKHGGNGLVQAFAGSQAGLQTQEPRLHRYPTEFHNTVNDTGPGARLLEILRKHSEEEINSQIGKARAIAGYYADIMLECRVCYDCLTVVLDGSIIMDKDSFIIAWHRCDPGWLFSNSLLLK
jgi:hypothetical protein